MLCVTSSRIAALLLKGGQTAYSQFKIPLNLTPKSTYGIKKNSYLARLLQKASLIIQDEVLMQHKYCFKAVDRTLQDIIETNKLFSGILVIFSRDFAQILLVILDRGRANIINACLQRSPLQRYFKILRLTKNMQVARIDLENREFI